MRLTLLQPDLVVDIVMGRQPRCLSLNWFAHHPLPLDWDEQRAVIEAFDA